MMQQNEENQLPNLDLESSTTCASADADDCWENIKDNEIMQQQSAILAEEAAKFPFLGDKEPLCSLAAEYESGSSILLQKIKVLNEQNSAIRRTRGDGNCFFRSFMFSYLEHIFESQDLTEVGRVKANVENCRKTLQNLGYADFTFEDFFLVITDLSLKKIQLFLEQLEGILQGNEGSISHEELVQRSRDQSISDYDLLPPVRKRAEFFSPFILDLTSATVEQFCKSSVEPMGEESDHMHITALSDALGVPIRVVYLLIVAHVIKVESL